MNPRFSIILLHYNQEEYIYEALDSIISQTYNNIELIIADDSSNQFDKVKIEKYLKNKSNIKDLKFMINKKNIGTVKTLNKCVKMATGEYLLFFAADDKLYDKNTLNNYIKTFKKISSDYDIVTSQCYMYDSYLKNKQYDFVSKYYEDRVNGFSSRELYNILTKECIFAAGATAYKTKLFKKVKYFDETYKVIEDWSFYLKCSRLGVKIHYEPFGGLKHRSGGISHNTSKEMPPHVIQYHKDICKIYANEIFPNYEIIDKKIVIELVRKYANYSKKYKENAKLPGYINYLINIYLTYKFAISLYRKIISTISSGKFIIANVALLYLALSFNNYKIIHICNIYCIVLLLIVLTNYIFRRIKRIIKHKHRF